MRIAVDFRFISGGPNVVNRGTGRYAQHQIEQVLKIDRDNQYLLICHKDANINLISPDILGAPNLTILYIPVEGMRIEDHPNEPERLLRLCAQYQEWLESQHIDLYHAVAPYQVNEMVLPHIDICPFVTNLYDLIPIIYPDKYWGPGQPFHEELKRAFVFLRRSDRLIAISESARNDGHKYLGVPKERIDIAYPFPDPKFKIMPKSWTENIMNSIRRKLRIPGNFILSVTHMHYSKNLETLVAAYSRIQPQIREITPLVITFHLTPEYEQLVRGWIDKYGVQENVILTGLVSDDELIALYNEATIFVHPSRYEGFGLTVVEAMSCGAPVITTTSSSLPEISGNAAILVDPDDVHGFAESILYLLQDPSRRKEMSNLGLENVKRFSAEQLGLSTLESYRKAIDASRSTLDGLSVGQSPIISPKRQKVAIWSSLPPLRCGIAEYTYDILHGLSQYYDIDLIVDDGYIPLYDIMQSYRVYNYRLFDIHYQKARFDSIIYQLGYSFMHYYMYDSIRKYPGCVVIHDVCFSYGLYFVYAVRNEIDSFRQKVVGLEEEDVVPAFDEALSRGDESLRQFLRQNLLLNWVISNSLVQVTHLEYARDIIKSRYPKSNVRTIDMGVRDPWKGLPVLNKGMVRLLLNLPIDGFIVGLFGYIAPIKRIDVVIRAFKFLVDVNKNSLLVVVGSEQDLEYSNKVKSIVSGMNLDRNVKFLGYLPSDEFEKYLLAIDVLVNLRYPSILQMSSVMARSIAAGNPVIISDIPEWRYLPDDFCARILPDENEVQNLARVLIEMAGNRDILLKASRSARKFYEERFSLAHCVQQYAQLIDEVSYLSREA